MDHNPLLKPGIQPGLDDAARKGSIERPEAVVNIVWQTRAAPPTDYETRLGDALVECFAAGIEEIEPLVARLNAMGVAAPDGAPWTAARFEREMARLGG